MILTNLLPGRKFTVQDNFPVKPRGLLPNSTGFVAYPTFIFNSIKKSVIPTSGKVFLIVTRKGKSGKDRIEKAAINIPILYDKELLKKDFKKYEMLYGHDQIIKTEQLLINTMELKNVDFIAWAMAYRMYLQQLYKYSGFNLKFLPKKSNAPFNKIEHIKDLFSQSPEQAGDEIDTLGKRAGIIKSFREVEKTIHKAVVVKRENTTIVTEQTVANLISAYKGREFSDKYIKSAEALKYLVKRDGPMASKKYFNN